MNIQVMLLMPCDSNEAVNHTKVECSSQCMARAPFCKFRAGTGPTSDDLPATDPQLMVCFLVRRSRRMTWSGRAVRPQGRSRAGVSGPPLAGSCIADSAESQSAREGEGEREREKEREPFRTRPPAHPHKRTDTQGRTWALAHTTCGSGSAPVDGLARTALRILQRRQALQASTPRAQRALAHTLGFRGSSAPCCEA